MSDALIDEIANEVVKDLKVSASSDDIKRYIKSAAYDLKTNVVGRELSDDLDPTTNLNVRDYLINFAKYSYYGITNEFHSNYQRLARSIQIEAGI